MEFEKNQCTLMVLNGHKSALGTSAVHNVIIGLFHCIILVNNS